MKSILGQATGGTGRYSGGMTATEYLPSDRPDLDAILGTDQQAVWGERLRGLVYDTTVDHLTLLRAGVRISVRRGVPAFPAGEWSVVDPRTRCATTLTLGAGGHYYSVAPWDAETGVCAPVGEPVGEAMRDALDGASMLYDVAGDPYYVAEWPMAGCLAMADVPGYARGHSTSGP